MRSLEGVLIVQRLSGPKMVSHFYCIFGRSDDGIKTWAPILSWMRTLFSHLMSKFHQNEMRGKAVKAS